MRNSDWSREELIVAFNLYLKTSFGKIDAKNKAVIELASIIGRTPSAVDLKLVNFARLDPSLKARNISGMSHGSKAEIAIWEEFSKNPEALAYQSELILAQYKKLPIEKSADISIEDLPEGKEREALVKTRVNQSFFRQTILASYDNKCCITGISVPELLVASHIIHWARDKTNRMNPCNGLCLNALHDRAFDKGLITITPEYYVKLSPALQRTHAAIQTFFMPYENTKITLPQRFMPSKECIVFHNKNIFIN